MKDGQEYVRCVCCDLASVSKWDVEVVQRNEVSKGGHHVSEAKQAWDFSEVKRKIVFRPRLQEIERYAPGRRLLDIGCSNGAFIEATVHDGWDAQGVELRNESVRFARNRGMTIYDQSLEHIGFLPSSFDVLTIWQVIEHIDSPAALLAECRKILRSGGLVAVSTPNLRSIGWKVLQSAWPAVDPKCHCHLFCPYNLQMLFAQSGFQACSVKTIELQPATFKALKRKLMGKPEKNIPKRWQHLHVRQVQKILPSFFVSVHF
jgi:SAM-dependent methyltransferase